MRDILIAHGADFIGRDHQIDVYYQTPRHRLKLRRGNIENALIAYSRSNSADPKRSDVLLYRTKDPSGLKEILDATFEIETIVDKHRDIYFIGNVKFHVDDVKGLGTFVEIEAIDETGMMSDEMLQKQCRDFMTLLDIDDEDLLTHSYSDMIVRPS